ncbi:MAG: TonB-dependent receptor [Pseudomonadota bacterium]|nr:TonB-dependent receptor [Pseudomonadota bacterium]
MNLKSNKLRDAVLLALLTTGGFAGAAMAQEQPQQDAKTLDTIQVTGTRIQSQTMTASSPVSEIEQEAFAQTGATRAEDLVNQYPQMNLSFDSFDNNGAKGYPTVNLRSLGAGRTLTLVNSQRLPPGTDEDRDISIVPAALIKRVDLLSGGASAVYGSDAIAGVVNFILDTDFEGVSLGAGMSAYQHKNDNRYIQGLMDKRGFQYPKGSSGFDGFSRNIDVALGGKFGDGRGHAMAWLSWRKNEALMQGERDYSSCALNKEGVGCGGSATAASPNFFVFDRSNPDKVKYLNIAHLKADGSWGEDVGELYNYAPINYYQRPDTRYNFGAAVRYEVNDYFRPYAELMYINRKSSIQVAESGTFFGQKLNLTCDNPLLGSLCADLGIDQALPLQLRVGKRNVEGGPRHFAHSTSSWRIVGGVEGDINQDWGYNASYVFGRTENTETARGDFLSDRVEAALLGCPAGSFSGCIPYNVWQPGKVTVEAAKALEGVGMSRTSTSMAVLNGYVSGNLGFGFASAQHDPVKLVVGYEWRKESYDYAADSNMAAGNFTGSGGPSLPLSGEISVRELFMESAVPLVASEEGFLKNLSLDLGYRLSDYSHAKRRADTWKIGANADFGMFRLRGGYNKAIRAPSIGELYASNRISLFDGEDPCAGANPKMSQAQCALMGVSASQYGSISASPAGQYNQFVGGSLNLTPEQAKTWTFGVAATPLENLDISLDMYDIKMEDRISSVGASTILNLCGQTGNPTLCGFIRRSASGDLWLGSDPSSSGYVLNMTGNFGKSHHRGLDFTVAYGWNVLGGRLSTSLTGSRVLKAEYDNLPEIANTKYDCAGKVNASCQMPKWRHIANIGFSLDRYRVGLRWRHIGAMDYVDAVTGAKLTTDTLVVGNGHKLSSVNYLDLSGSVSLGPVDLTVGVNNIADKAPPMVGNTLSNNGNAPGGYDQAGRYFFTGISMKF